MTKLNNIYSIQEPVAVESPPIGLYFQSLINKGGGAERQLFALAAALSERGHEVHVISWDNCHDQSFYSIPCGITWHKLGSGDDIIGKLKKVKKLRTLLMNFKIKCLIGFVMANNKVVMLSALLSGTTLIAAERNGPSIYHIKHSLVSRWINFLSLLTCKFVVIQFDDFKIGYPKFLHDRIKVMRNPIFPAQRQALPGAPPKKKFQMLFVGRFDPIQKQPAILIEAFTIIAEAKPNWFLKIVGDGSDDAKALLEQLIHNSGFETRIKLTPSTLNIAELYEESDLLVIPSLWEGSPNSLTEAMAHGLPAVGFRVDGIQQLIKHGITGWVAETVNATSLAETLIKATEKPHMLAEVGQAAQKASTAHPENLIYDAWSRLIVSVRKKNGIK